MATSDCTVPYFGFKAKLGTGCNGYRGIVLCLILDSRQNYATEAGMSDLIVLCLILDSRQNNYPQDMMKSWIVLCLILDSRQNNKNLDVVSGKLYCALFWIQGKTKDRLFK